MAIRDSEKFKLLLLLLLTIVVGCEKSMGNNSNYKNLICENGYSLIDEKCVKEIVVESKEELYCQSDYVLANNECLRKLTIDPSVIYDCPKGYSLSNAKCIKKTTKNPSKHITCPYPHEPSGDICVAKREYAIMTQYYCSNSSYSLIGDKCRHSYTAAPIMVNGNLACSWPSQPNNCTLRGTSCDCVSTVQASIRFVCVIGNLSNGKCIVEDRTGPVATYLLCDGGYHLNGNICEKTESLSASTTKKCGEGYEFVNGSCEKVEYVLAEKRLACEDGFVLKEKQCYKQEIKEPTLEH